MKKAYLLLLLIVPLFTSCHKNTAEKEDGAVAIIGKWHWIKQSYKSFANNQLQNEEVYTDFSLDSYFGFSKAGVFTEYSAEQGGRTYNGSYRIVEDGKKVIVKRDVDVEELVFEIRKLDKYQLIVFQIFKNPQNPNVYSETEFVFRRGEL